MKDVMFGQMYPVDSVIHRMDPRAKLLITIIYIVAIFFINSFIVYAATAVVLLFVIFLSRVPLPKVLKSIKVVIVLLIFTLLITVLFTKGDRADPINDLFYIEWGVITICPTGLINGGKLMCRLLLLVIGPTMLTLTTTPVALTDAIEYLLSPLKLIKVPVHTFALIMSIALRLVPTLMEETDKIINAQKARGASFDHGNIFKRAAALLPVLIPLFVNSFRRADELADAMDSRCYRGAKGRTKMKVMKFAAFDWAAMLASAAFLFVILLAAYNWWNFDWLSAILIA